MKRWFASSFSVLVLGFPLFFLSGKNFPTLPKIPKLYWTGLVPHRVQFMGSPLPTTDPQVYVEVEKVKVRLAQVKTKQEFDNIVNNPYAQSLYNFEHFEDFNHFGFLVNQLRIENKAQRDALP